MDNKVFFKTVTVGPRYFQHDFSLLISILGILYYVLVKKQGLVIKEDVADLDYLTIFCWCQTLIMENT